MAAVLFLVAGCASDPDAASLSAGSDTDTFADPAAKEPIEVVPSRTATSPEEPASETVTKEYWTDLSAARSSETPLGVDLLLPSDMDPWGGTQQDWTVTWGSNSSGNTVAAGFQRSGVSISVTQEVRLAPPDNTHGRDPGDLVDGRHGQYIFLAADDCDGETPLTSVEFDRGDVTTSVKVWPAAHCDKTVDRADVIRWLDGFEVALAAEQPQVEAAVVGKTGRLEPVSSIERQPSESLDIELEDAAGGQLLISVGRSNGNKWRDWDTIVACAPEIFQDSSEPQPSQFLDTCVSKAVVQDPGAPRVGIRFSAHSQKEPASLGAPIVDCFGPSGCVLALLEISPDTLNGDLIATGKLELSAK